MSEELSESDSMESDKDDSLRRVLHRAFILAAIMEVLCSVGSSNSEPP